MPARHLPIHAAVVVGLIICLRAIPTMADTGACRGVTDAALRSCRAGAQRDRWLALGKCENGPDTATQTTCEQQVAVETKDDLASCREQSRLRLEVCGRLGEAPYTPVIDPANFVAAIDNPYFPLVPGTTFVYEGQTSEGFEHVEFAVTHATKVILGVTCVEIHDTRRLDGVLLEDTRDWFAQDQQGNVWYFGENTTLVDAGLPVDLSGTWTGGVDGAQPGIIMKAQPAVGAFYRQEFLLGEAEDNAEVSSTSASTSVPVGSFTNCLQTEETSPRAPGDIEHKFYAAGIGNLLTIELATGERSELVRIIRE